jgi:hypothetical protein
MRYNKYQMLIVLILIFIGIIFFKINYQFILRRFSIIGARVRTKIIFSRPPGIKGITAILRVAIIPVPVIKEK